MPRPARVAIAHDYLNQRGGAERVVLALAAIWPDAPIYTSLYRPASTFPEFGARDIRTSVLDRLPADAAFRALFPLYPAAFAQVGPVDADVVVASSSGWAHGIRTTATTTRVIYCHTPARWLYAADRHLGATSLQQRLVRPLVGAMRRWDAAAASRADVYVANSENVRRRIREVYGRDAHLVYPPVDVHRFVPRPRGERLLVVSRLLDYKRVDAVIRAANRAKLPLDVVGSGPSAGDLRKLAGPTVTFHPGAADDEVTALMESCRALVLPGEEDFGIVPVEAQACGRPVVALGRAGALGTVLPEQTGLLVQDDSEEALADAMRRALSTCWDSARIRRHAEQFSRERFLQQMSDVVEQTMTRPDPRQW